MLFVLTFFLNRVIIEIELPTDCLVLANEESLENKHQIDRESNVMSELYYSENEIPACPDVLDESVTLVYDHAPLQTIPLEDPTMQSSGNGSGLEFLLNPLILNA